MRYAFISDLNPNPSPMVIGASKVPSATPNNKRINPSNSAATVLFLTVFLNQKKT